MRMRRIKFPVFSRLTVAWLAFVAIGAAFTAYSLIDSSRKRAIVAMAVEGVERLAPPPDHVQTRSAPPERLASAAEAASPIPAAASDDASDMLEIEDTLAAIDGPAMIARDEADEVIITVDGAPARAIGAEPSKPVTQWMPIAAPAADLLKRSAYGSVPRIADDGRTPSKIYAQPFKPTDKPHIALIVGGLGINRAVTERAIDDLPPYVTLAFAPYSKDLAFWSKRAREAGHEILLEIPMENRTGDAEALGPAALLTTRTPEENTQRLDWIMSRFGGYFGVTNYLGAKFSGDSAALDALLHRIDGAGLAYIDDTGALSRARFKGEGGVVNRIIDPGYGNDAGLTKRDLETLEKIAKADGDALGKTYVHDATLEELVAWAASLEERGLALAPASAILAMRDGDR